MTAERRIWIKAMITSEIWKRDIKERAGEIYSERMKNGFPGDELSDWLTAESDIVEEIVNYYAYMEVDPARRYDKSPHLLKYHAPK